ncbi:hypothetical protein [Streptomyces sp. NPDC048489]|uniref:hypothetical protein n=1 Tax=Streptomyces sp. NPDC048489 TaxID=3154504 RepID=UPI003433D03A
MNDDRQSEGVPHIEAAKPRVIPRDPLDQQARRGTDRLDVTGADGQPTEERQVPPDLQDPDPAIPDTDEAGTGRKGGPHSASTRPGRPVPDESPD